MIFQAKLEYDKTLNSTPVNSKARIGPEGIKVAPRSAFKRELLSNHLLRDRFGLLKDQLTDFPGFMLGIKVCMPIKIRNGHVASCYKK